VDTVGPSHRATSPRHRQQAQLADPFLAIAPSLDPDARDDSPTAPFLAAPRAHWRGSFSPAVRHRRESSGRGSSLLRFLPAQLDRVCTHPRPGLRQDNRLVLAIVGHTLA
jgi:hypothetical protein